MQDSRLVLVVPHIVDKVCGSYEFYPFHASRCMVRYKLHAWHWLCLLAHLFAEVLCHMCYRYGVDNTTSHEIRSVSFNQVVRDLQCCCVLQLVPEETGG